MSFVTTIDLFCDGQGCVRWRDGAVCYPTSRARSRTQKSAVEDGWSVERVNRIVKHYCPTCTTKRAKEKRNAKQQRRRHL
jgi:hypothetical protein